MILQSLLQNTLEQLVIALGVYTAWSLLMPASWLSVVPLCSMLFAIGRIFFFKGYKQGAPARAHVRFCSDILFHRINVFSADRLSTSSAHKLALRRWSLSCKIGDVMPSN